MSWTKNRPFGGRAPFRLVFLASLALTLIGAVYPGWKLLWQKEPHFTATLGFGGMQRITELVPISEPIGVFTDLGSSEKDDFLRQLSCIASHRPLHLDQVERFNILFHARTELNQLAGGPYRVLHETGAFRLVERYR